MADKKVMIKVYVTEDQKAAFKEAADKEGESISGYFLDAALSKADVKKIVVGSDDILFIAKKLTEVENSLKLIQKTAKDTNSVVEEDVVKIRKEFDDLEKTLAKDLKKVFNRRKTIREEAIKIIEEDKKTFEEK